jgi:hypothetical protein
MAGPGRTIRRRFPVTQRQGGLRSRPFARAAIAVPPFASKLAGSVYSGRIQNEQDRPETVADAKGRFWRSGRSL